MPSLLKNASVLLACLLAAVPLPLAVAADSPATAPAPEVTRVVLYKHGMGYVERQGKVKDDATLTLAFRADQMKDLLTSFYAVDLSGGRIASVRYEASDPLSRQLQDILIRVPEQAALSQFLSQLQGARVSLKASGESFSGRILGVEPTSETTADGTVKPSFRLVVLTDAGPIRSTDLLGLSELTLADEAMRRDLSRLLDLTLDGKHTNRKRLTLTAAGKGEREIRLGYLLEMPVWKASYRLILDGKEKDTAFLQGWAQAENTTEEDWNSVALSFVAGNPFSYVMDLYSPLYVKRPVVPVPGLQDLAVDWGETTPPEAMPSPAPAMMEAYAAAAPAPARMAAKSLGYANVAQTMDVMGGGAGPGSGGLLAASAGAGAQGAKVGELFSYTALDRVSIPRGQAALVPIVSRALKGRRVVYYKQAFSPKPTDAWVLANDTDLTFEAGAVTFFEGGTSLGEGILGHVLPPGSQEVIPYAADASVDVTPQAKAELKPYFAGRLVDGILRLTRTETLTTSWRLVNRGKEPATLWLNQPRNPLYQLGKPEKPLKEVDNHYRFEVVLAPGESRDFAVEERRDLQETVEVGHSDETRIRLFASAEYLTPATRSLLAEAGKILADKSALARQIAEWQGQVSRLTEEQNRLRDNINTLRTDIPAERDLRAKWVASLASTEEQGASLRGRIDEASGKVRALEEELARKVRGFKE